MWIKIVRVVDYNDWMLNYCQKLGSNTKITHDSCYMHWWNSLQQNEHRYSRLEWCWGYVSVAFWQPTLHDDVQKAKIQRHYKKNCNNHEGKLSSFVKLFWVYKLFPFTATCTTSACVSEKFGLLSAYWRKSCTFTVIERLESTELEAPHIQQPPVWF